MIGPFEIGVGFVLMLVLMFMGLHVATVMAGVAMIGAVGYLGTPAVFAFGNQLWGATEDYVLLSIPLYILLGEILVRGGATDRMYASLADWLNPLPGGLLHTNVGASALFSAVSGSSVATAATISTIALPAFRHRGYDQRLVLGSIASLPVVLEKAAQVIMESGLTDSAIKKAGEVARTELGLLTNLYTSAGYKRQLAEVLVTRALSELRGKSAQKVRVSA